MQMPSLCAAADCCNYFMPGGRGQKKDYCSCDCRSRSWYQTRRADPIPREPIVKCKSEKCCNYFMQNARGRQKTFCSKLCQGREHTRRWRVANYDLSIECNRRWRRENKERWREICRKSDAAHPETKRANNRLSRTRVRDTKHALTLIALQQLFKEPASVETRNP